MQEMGAMLQGIYDMMLDVQVPIFGIDISLWMLFLFGALGAVIVWFLRKFFN